MNQKIFLDESGNTGCDLLNKDQKVYILCSTDVCENEAIELLNRYFDVTREIHFKKLKNSNSGKQHIKQFFFENFDFINEHCKSVVFHKEYTACCHLVNYCIEPLFYEDDTDFYDAGMNIAFANMLYFCLPSFCGIDTARNIYQYFIDIIRTHNDESIKKFMDSLEIAKNKCSDIQFKKEVLDLLIESTNFFSETLSELSWKSLDPSLPAFIDLCEFWMKKYSQGIEINHDESRTMEMQQDEINFLRAIEKNPIEIGYGKFKSTYPLNINNLTFCQSQNLYSIQLCDLVASTLGYLYNNQQKEDDSFVKDLTKLFNSYQLINIVWPSTDVNLNKDRKKVPGDINPVDYLAFKHWQNNAQK